MPDTEAEKQVGLNDCNKCKYSAECLLLADWKRQATLVCKLGVK